MFNERLNNSYSSLLPNASKWKIKLLTFKRYIEQSHEEVEAARLITKDFKNQKVRYEGLEELLDFLASNNHGYSKNSPIVFLTAHFGCSIIGTGLLTPLRKPILGMSSNVVDNPRVHKRISLFFRKKYAALNRHLLGGEIIDKEGNLRTFSQFLKQNGIVVIVGDTPPDNKDDLHWHNWNDVFVGLPKGAAKLAQKNNALFHGFVCTRDKDTLVVTFSAPGEDPYQFIFNQIDKRPALWWAADIYDLYPKK